MRKPMLVLLSLVLAVVMWGCGDRGHESGGSPVSPPVHTGEINPGELHNEVMMAFQKRAPLESIPSMQWDGWLETTLNSMEEVFVAHDIPFDRAEMSQHIVQLTRIFGAIYQATGIDPGNLRESETPEADMSRIVAQLETWKLIDHKTATTVLEFRVDEAAGARAEGITDAALRDVFRIGASSREFWLAHEKRTPIERLGDSDWDPPCKKCMRGATISDYLGGVIGRILCGGSAACRAAMAAAASLLYNMVSTDDGPYGWGWPLFP